MCGMWNRINQDVSASKHGDFWWNALGTGREGVSSHLVPNLCHAMSVLHPAIGPESAAAIGARI